MAILKELRKQFKHFIQPEEDAPIQEPAKAGLEQIYKLENVDIRTVRPMNTARQEEEAPSLAVPIARPLAMKAKAPEPSKVQKEQSELLDLGEECTECTESFRLYEPLEVLSLSGPCLKALQDNERRLIRDVVRVKPEEWVGVKGLGQGHIDELQDKLAAYVGGKPLLYATSVDFSGLLRCVTADVNPLRAALCFSEYGLKDLFPLSPSQDVELRHMSDEKRRALVEEARMEVGSEKRRRLLKEQLQRLSEAFLKPWMRRRFGLATACELVERLERKAEDPEFVQPILRCLSEIFFEGRSLFYQVLPVGEKDVFVVDANSKRAFLRVSQRAESYFYKPTASYPLHQLVRLLEQDFAKVWEGFSEGFVAKVLRYNPKFRVRKNASQVLEVRLAWAP